MTGAFNNGRVPVLKDNELEVSHPCRNKGQAPRLPSFRRLSD
jgi:hypothetical protein